MIRYDALGQCNVLLRGKHGQRTVTWACRHPLIKSWYPTASHVELYRIVLCGVVQCSLVVRSMVLYGIVLTQIL